MTSWSMVALVMSREIRQRVRSRSFAVTTVLICVGILGLGVLNRVLSGDDSPTTYDVSVVGGAPEGFEQTAHEIAAALDIVVRVQPAASRNEAEQQVIDSDVDVAVDPARGELVSQSAPPDELTAVVNAAWQASASRRAAVDAGLDQAAISAILAPDALRTVEVEPDGESDETVGTVVGFATAILLFISINAFGGIVLTGVVEEKSTGVVEVLLAHVRAHQLLAGKVFGIGVVAMMQLSAGVITGLVALRLSGASVPNEVWVGLPTTLLWFVCGFVLYSTLYALAGSFVSRQEDAQGAAAPISIVFTAAYLTVFVLGAEPTSTATRIVSVLPPFSPLLMPLRVSAGAASGVEIIVAAVLLIAATYGMMRLAGGVYGRTLLHRGSRLRWREAMKMKSA